MRLLLAALLFALVGLVFAAAPAGRDEALAWIASPQVERRGEAVVWIAAHGTFDDAALLHARLRDASPSVRAAAEQGLWQLWTRSGDAQTDRIMARGIEATQAQQYAEAEAIFSEVIRRQPALAEGWNKRATVRYFAGDFTGSMRDCDEVLARNPLHFGALSGYGMILFALERYEEALVWWKKALAVNPNLHGVAENIDLVEKLLEARRRRAI